MILFKKILKSKFDSNIHQTVPFKKIFSERAYPPNKIQFPNLKKNALPPPLPNPEYAPARYITLSFALYILLATSSNWLQSKLNNRDLHQNFDFNVTVLIYLVSFKDTRYKIQNFI